jgi:hypothetical protein
MDSLKRKDGDRWVHQPVHRKSVGQAFVPGTAHHTVAKRGAGFRVWPIDYAVVDETRIGRTYREPIHGEMKWRWFLQTVPAPPPYSGMADTLDEAKAAFAKRYAEITTQRAKR